MRILPPIFLTLIIFLLFSPTLKGQVYIGLNMGTDVSSFISKGESASPEIHNFKETYKAGFRVSVPLEIKLSSLFSLQPEISLVQKGTQTQGLYRVSARDSLEINTRQSLSYIQVPILVKVQANKGVVRPFLNIGPGFSYLLSGTIVTLYHANIDFAGYSASEIKKLDFKEDNTYHRFEFSAIAGLGMDLDAGPGKLTSEVRYQRGISYLVRESLFDLKNQGFAFSLGYKIDLSKIRMVLGKNNPN